MQYVDFGRTGLRVSRLGFGGIPVQRIDEPGTRAMLKAAHEAGINYIDTARAYTVSEEWIGQALEELGLRGTLFLAALLKAHADRLALAPTHHSALLVLDTLRGMGVIQVPWPDQRWQIRPDAHVDVPPLSVAGPFRVRD